MFASTFTLVNQIFVNQILSRQRLESSKMCESWCDADATRRQFVSGALAMAAAGLAGCAAVDSDENGVILPTPLRPFAPVTVADGLTIHPRDDWGADLAPKGPLYAEDVRFLLIHHTATSNNISNPRRLIRSVYTFHTGSQKRWNDVAYNFFVGPDGSVWEGRAGSLAGPVIADATGGNQGFSQLICLLGTFSNVSPTTAAQQSLVKLMAFLAERHGLSTWRDATATFISRGSNKLPAGTAVSTSTISGHRDMTYTACPGDIAYGLLPTWRQQVHAIVAARWQQTGNQPATRLSLQAP